METATIKKVIPHDKEAEQSVIGSMMLSSDAVLSAMEIITAEDFYNRSYGILFETMVDLYNSGKAVDPIILQSELRKKDVPEEVSNLEYIADLINTVPTSANVAYYAEIVKNKSVLRNLIKVSEDISSRCYSDNEEVSDIMEDAEKNVFKLAQTGSLGEHQSIDNVMIEVLNQANKAAQSHSSVTGVPSGFHDLDYKTAGFQNSDLILLAARPSMGKTAFALNIAQNVAIKKKIPIAIFSLEMSNAQLGGRLASMESRVEAQKIRTGNLDSGEWKNFVDSIMAISKTPIILDDTPGISPSQLRSKCRKYKIEQPDLGMIIIDYLQLMSSNRKSDSRQQEISEISRSLKELARELNIPVIALSQLSRAVEKRDDKRPMLSDLRESGAIEQDADVVMFLYREDYYVKDTEKKNITEVIIAKQRSGPVGTIELLWLPQYTKFEDLEKPRGVE